MNAAPYFLGMAALFGIVCYGLLNRTLWMWRFAWILFYLLAAKWGEWFFTALREAKDNAQVGWACVYLAGGLVIWLPTVLWWANARPLFGGKPPTPPR
ncbi:MAG TPA: hypothetical protein VGE29_14050 [Prosthecobacter sp.]